MALLVMSQANGESSTVGSLFNGLAFFVLQKVPSRTHYVDLLKANGGRVVKTEGQADHVIADQLRKDAPAGSISYEYITTAIRTGELPDPADHPAGPPLGALREVGSIAIPGKTTRTPFTAEDDKVLWQWVERLRQEGGSVKGNEIYKQLEVRNSRHTYQAWRDRYIKKLMNTPPAGVQVTVAANAPPSPPAASDGEADVEDHREKKEPVNDGTIEAGATRDVMTDENGAKFTAEDFDNLMLNAGDIMKVDADRGDEAWAAWALTFTSHPADTWRVYWEENVLPIYLERRDVRRRKRNLSTEERASPSKRTRSSTTSKSAQIDDGDSTEIIGPHSMMSNLLIEQSTPKALSSSRTFEILSDVVDLEARAAVEPPFEASETNRAAEEQLRKDMSLPHPIDDEAIAIDQQARPVPESDGDGNIAKDEADTTISHYLIEDGEVEDGLPGEDVLDDEFFGNALTEANLATQEGQSRPQQPVRGIDIPADDPSKDQGSYADYLRNLIGSVPGQGAAFDVQAQAPRMQFPLLSDAALDDTMYTHNDGNLFSDLPMSSQQEVDDAFEVNLDWPSSPQQVQKTPMASQTQDRPLQTGVHYRELPNGREDEADDDMFSAQPPELQVEYPPLPVTTTVDERQMQEEAFGVQRVPANATMVVEGLEVSNDVVIFDDGEENDEYFDLTLPEPEGGFGFSPSPIRASAGQEGEQSAMHVQSEHDNVELAKPHPDQRETVSSAEDPSSSFEDSSPESSSQPHSNKTGKRALETQDILNAETQQPDLEVPLPPDSDDDEDEADAGNYRLSSKPLRSTAPAPVRTQQARDYRQMQPSTRAPTHPYLVSRSTANRKALKQQAPPQALESQAFTEPLHLDTYIQTACLHYKVDEATVITALKATNMRPDPAELVMLELKAGRGLPKDVPGVWSEAEDVVIEGGDARRMNVVAAKHSWEEVQARLEFLNEWRVG
ncbi:hypothetical protein LTR78_006178 [Recurvomyces mirabilis]|uniref:DNA-binding protein RAP1 n=1 Tax=Recurvomyces mirabilis TaxID=574656 RepID=A0AAE0WLN1_9PEZI|nr:hypothetical protein LTR78_006178 [Recurvomyces mirabilis]KAK5152020.1 hypothetical protein LTS14_008794 [Recurvomyces mirabilis]